MQLSTQVSVGDGQLLVNIGKLGKNVAVGNCCHGQIVKGLGDVDGRVGAMNIVLGSIRLILLLAVMVHGGEELLEMDPGFFNFGFALPLFAGFIVKISGAYGMICRLQDLFCCESDVAIGGILDSGIDALEINFDQLRGVDGLIHFFLHSLTSTG